MDVGFCLNGRWIFTEWMLDLGCLNVGCWFVCRLDFCCLDVGFWSCGRWILVVWTLYFGCVDVVF